MLDSITLDGRGYLSSKKLSGIIKYNPNYIRRLARENVIPYVQIRNKYFFNEEDVLAALRSDTGAKVEREQETGAGASEDGQDIVYDI